MTDIDLTELEEKRQRYLQVYTMGVPMGFAVTCAIAALNGENGAAFPWVAVSIITFGITVAGFQVINGLYRRQTKKALLNQIAESMNLNYHRNGVFSLGDFASHRIAPACDRVVIEDGFSGTIGSVPVAFEEMQLTTVNPRQNDNEQDQEDIVFQGLALQIGLGKRLEAHTVVLQKNAVMVSLETLLSKYQKINLVSPAFEKHFTVLSTDQVEARYVLDPAFMEAFLNAANVAGLRNIQASFRDQTMAMTIEHRKPLFEIGWIWQRLDHRALSRVHAELDFVTNVVTALKLNPYTGLGASK